MTNHAGQTLDITKLVLGFDIYESLYLNSLTGTIDITDANDYLQFFPIIGEETIEIDMVLPGFDDNSNFVLSEYRIYKITDRVINSDKVQTYKLWFTSPEFIIDFEKKVSKAWYEKTTHSMVKDVFKILESKKVIDVESTVGVHNYFATNFTPLQILNYLASHRSINSDKMSDFMFFESFDVDNKTTKFNFKSLGYLAYSQDPIAEFTYNPVNINDDSWTSAGNVQPYNIENISFKKGFDIIDAKMKGFYNQTFVYYDILRKRCVYQKNAFDDVNSETGDKKIEGAESNPSFVKNTGGAGESVTIIHSTGLPNRIDNSANMSNKKNKGTETKPKRGDNGYIAKKGSNRDSLSNLTEETLYRRKILLHEFDLNKINLNDISGNYRYTVGSVILFNKPHIMINKFDPIEKYDEVDDLFISGRYLITKSRHHVRRGDGLNWVYKNYLEVSKNAIKNSLNKL
jgi:hypothetical protein